MGSFKKNIDKHCPLSLCVHVILHVYCTLLKATENYLTHACSYIQITMNADFDILDITITDIPLFRLVMSQCCLGISY